MTWWGVGWVGKVRLVRGRRTHCWGGGDVVGGKVRLVRGRRNHCWGGGGGGKVIVVCGGVMVMVMLWLLTY